MVTTPGFGGSSPPSATDALYALFDEVSEHAVLAELGEYRRNM